MARATTATNALATKPREMLTAEAELFDEVAVAAAVATAVGADIELLVSTNIPGANG